MGENSDCIWWEPDPSESFGKLDNVRVCRDSQGVAYERGRRDYNGNTQRQSDTRGRGNYLTFKNRNFQAGRDFTEKDQRGNRYNERSEGSNLQWGRKYNNGEQNSFQGKSSISYSDKEQWGNQGVKDGENNEDYPNRRFSERGRRGAYNKNNAFNNIQKNKDIATRSFNQSRKNDDDEFEVPLTDDGLVDYEKLQKLNEEQEKRRFAHLPSVEKCTYIEQEEVSQITPEEVAVLRKNKNDISIATIDGTELRDIPNLITKFEHAFHPYPEMMDVINAMGFKEPTPIQCQMWPIAMSGRDVIGIAQTGTGKTIAYLLPALLHIEKQLYFKDTSRTGPLCVILAPTRELAQQIHSEATKYSYMGIRSVCVYGQGDFRTQKEALQSGVEVVVATTGRLLDFVKRDVVDLRGVSYLVLDEADRMLDMGFMSEMVRIMYKIRPDRQTIMTTATWQFDIEYIVKKFMTSPLKINVGKLDLTAVDTVTQTVVVCEEDDKFAKLIEMLSEIKQTDKVLVFTNKKAIANYIPTFLVDKGIDYRMMHGDMDQSDREQSLKDLKSGMCNLMIATDVAARGLDIVDLTLVINFDLPRNMEEYVHRSGRTGRAGKTGEVISLVTWVNRSQVQQLIEILQRSNQDIPIELSRMAERAQSFKERNGEGRGGRGGRGRGGRGGNGTRGGRGGNRNRYNDWN